MTTQTTELVASFQEGRRYSPWPWRMSRAADENGAVRKMRGTPRWSVGRNVRDRRMFCPRAPWVYWSRIHTFSHNTTIG
jgi:hypothetical protein